jgi:hypothetical protein
MGWEDVRQIYTYLSQCGKVNTDLSRCGKVNTDLSRCGKVNTDLSLSGKRSRLTCTSSGGWKMPPQTGGFSHSLTEKSPKMTFIW